MARSEALGIVRLEDVVFYVHDLERSTRFYVDKLDFALTARSSEATEAASGERTRVFDAGQVRVTVTSPLTPKSVSARYLKRHPDGIATLVFSVKDIAATYQVLEERGATIVEEIVWERRGAARLGWFEITTAFGEGRFRFVQRDGWDWKEPNPGLHGVEVEGPTNRFHFDAYDHITSNFLTMKPMVLWCQDVLGLEEYWDIEFHTDDVRKKKSGDHGSGLKSIVLWDPHSGVKFANNEPKRPHFEASQIYTFVVDNLGPGFQHAALTTANIIETVRELRQREVVFMPTPGTYYDVLADRMEKLGVGRLEEDIDVLRELEILVDGKGPATYMLQIFLKEAAGLYHDDKAGPFFFEIIQRKGDKGFGFGNFRALFESIENDQRAKS